MEKQVNEKAHDLAADHVKHNHAHLGDPNRDLEHSKDHKDEMLDKGGKEILMTHEPHHDGNNGAGHQCEEIPLSPEKHACNETDVSTTRPSSETKDTHVNLAPGDEDAKAMQVHTGMPATHEKQEHNVEHAPGKLAVYEKQEHDVEHAPIITQDPPENTSSGVPTSHNEHADTVYESNEIQVSHGSVAHDHEVLAVTHEQMEKSTEHENATHDDEHVGHVSLDHESGESHTTHEKTIDGDKYTGVVHEAGQTHTAHEKHAYNAQNSEDTTHEKLTHVHTDTDKTLNAKHMHNEDTEHNLADKPSKHDDDADVALKHGQAHKCNVVIARASQEHGEKCRIEDDECESKKELADENSLKERVHFSRGSTPDVDTPTQQTSSPFSNTKSSKSGSKGAGNAERGPGSTDGNPETPSTSWAFSARASIAPSKFDHMATLRLTYGAYRESNRGKEGVPLSLLPEILESARFMVPPPRDLVPLLQRIDIDYKVGDLVRWSLLQNLALQIECKEARYPAVFIPRPSVVRPNSNSPNSWKALQRSPTRRTHPEDDCPELEPQVYEMMKEIDNHRRKSAKEGNYLAADAAAQRLLELKLFEDNKRRAVMLERHAQEREQAEKAYKGELQERNQLWDERLKNFQKEVVDHAQRLKQQHMAALHHFKEKMASKTPAKAQWSRELLKQRRIQVYLGKQGKYLEAQEVKQSADRMEQAELQAAIAAFQAELIGKEQTVRVKQQTEMDILLQRAARTREEIRKSRTLDLQRCHQRHKNVMRELAAIQKQEVFRFDQLMQKKVQNPYTGVVGLGGQRVAQSPARARINAPDYSTDDALYSGGEDGSMRD